MITSDFNSFQGNLDTDGNEQYGEFFGGPSILDNIASEENEFVDLMLDQDVNWLVEAACNRIKSSPQTLQQQQASTPPNFIDNNIKSHQRDFPQQGPAIGIPSTISIDQKVSSHDHESQSSSPQLSPPKDPKPKIYPTGTSESKNNDPKIIMSKSLPAFKPQQESSVQVSVEMSKTIDKKSVKGLLKGFYFEKEETASPYLQHLKKPNPLAGLDGEYALHKAVFSQKSKPKKQQKTENEKAQEKLQKLSKLKMKPPPKLDLKPFTPITSKGWEVLGIRRDQQVNDLFGRVENFKQQFNAPKTLHPIVDEPKGGNIMTSKPLSAKVFRTGSPSNMGTNDIDQIVSEQYVPPTPAFRPIQSPTTIQSPGISPPEKRQQLASENGTAKPNEHVKSRGLRSASAISDEANRIDAMDMLANIHNDPLYRIIKEEMDRIQKLSTPSTPIPSRAAAAEPILPSHVKVLSFFQSLPPSVWVTCRLVYFLIASYYETVILPPSFRLYREWTELEQFWAILDQHYAEFYLNLSNIPKQFSWTLLQDLLRVPKLFCKVLEVIEHGLKMSPEDWATFHNAVEKTYTSPTPNTPSLAATPTPAGDYSRPSTRRESSVYFPPADNCLLNVFDDEGFRDIFYESFPVQAFQPLRDMVKAGRGFLLTSSSALFAQAGHGAPIVPGTPLAISVALTSWVKRVVAMLYIAGTQRVRTLRSQQQQQHQQQQPAYASRSASPAGALPSPIPQSLTATGTSTGGTMASQLPPNLSFACIFNGIPGYLAITSQDFNLTSATPSISSTAMTVLQRYLRFFGVAASLVKPSDQLDVLLHALPVVNEQQPNSNSAMSQRNVDNNAAIIKSESLEIRLQQEIEMYLRMTTSSPLHKVKRFDYEVQFPVLAAVRFIHPWMEALHPWLAYQVLLQTGVIQPSSPLLTNTSRVPTNTIRTSQSAQPRDSSYNAQESFDIRPQTSPLRQSHLSSSSLVETNGSNKVYDLVMAPLFNHSDAAVIEPLVLRDKAFLCDSNLAQIVREKSNFSVAMISEGKSNPMQEDEYGLRASIKGNRYVVAVSESPASWNAFQMACRLAKESDTILLVYVPNLQPSGITRGSLTRTQYDGLILEMQQRRDALVQLYRTVGYNVLCASPPTYMDYARHVMETYITSNHLKTQAMQQLGPEGNNVHPYEGYAFYQQNMECRLIARSFLRTIQPLKPDFVILGADGDDILNALSYHYLHPHLAFKQTAENSTFSMRPSPPAVRSAPMSAPHENPYTHRPEHHHVPAHTHHSSQPQQLPQRMVQDTLTVVPEEDPLVSNSHSHIHSSSHPGSQTHPDNRLDIEITSITVQPTHTGTVGAAVIMVEEQYITVDEGDGFDDDVREETDSRPNDAQYQTNSNNASGGRLATKHTRVNSQMTMISALTEAVILGCDTTSSNNNKEDEEQEGQGKGDAEESNGGVYDDDDFVNEDEEENNPVDVTIANLSQPTHNTASVSQMSLQGDCERAVVFGEEPGQQQQQQPRSSRNKPEALDTSLDYNDLASFIIEDNDEGENSLSASPFLIARQHPHHPAAANLSAVSLGTPVSIEPMASDGRFTHPLPTPMSLPPSATSNPAPPPADSSVSPALATPVPDQSTTLRLQLFREYARERLSFSDVLLHELVTRTYWWPEYIREETMQRERRAKSLDPTEKEDPSIALIQRWMYEPVSCILTHLPTSPQTTAAAVFSTEEK